MRTMKKSNSRIHLGKGSMNHIGATPYRFRLDIFVSYVDNVKNATDVCVTWERRGNTQATSVATVKDKKAVFKQALSMESTLFRRVNNASKGASSANSEELKFDEKKAKFLLRKSAPDGKAIGKIHLNLADYIRGPTSTVFADMKLSNGSIIVTRIEATMLHMGKKKKNGSKAGSEACSETTDANSAGNDSLFGDDDLDLGDIEIETTPGPVDDKPSSTSIMSPVSSASASSTTSLSTKAAARTDNDTGVNSSAKAANPVAPPSPKASRVSRKDSSLSTTSSSGATPSKKFSQTAMKSVKEEEDLKDSPSLRNKLKKKMKGKKDKDNNKDDIGENASPKQKYSLSPEKAAEISELKGLVDSLRKENAKLKTSKQAAMDEIDALRSDLEACEAALESGDGFSNGAKGTLDMSKTLKEKDKMIAELEAQNEGLLEELEELHEGAVDSAVGVASGQIDALKEQIEELEVALSREPQYMDVVNELKVTKVSLALANMEKEQALFALQTHCGQQQTNDDSE